MRPLLCEVLNFLWWGERLSHDYWSHHLFWQLDCLGSLHIVLPLFFSTVISRRYFSISLIGLEWPSLLSLFSILSIVAPLDSVSTRLMFFPVVVWMSQEDNRNRTLISWLTLVARSGQILGKLGISAQYICPGGGQVEPLVKGMSWFISGIPKPVWLPCSKNCRPDWQHPHKDPTAYNHRRPSSKFS